VRVAVAAGGQALLGDRPFRAGADAEWRVAVDQRAAAVEDAFALGVLGAGDQHAEGARRLRGVLEVRLGVARAAPRLGLDLVKPVTLVGVAALGEPDLLVEVEAVAVLP